MTFAQTLRRLAPTAAFAALIAAGLGLASCVSLFPKTADATLYRFEARTPVAPASAQRQVAVLHVPTRFTAAAAGDRILTVTGNQAAYIAGARWVAPATTLFDEAVNHSLESSPSIRLSAQGDMSRPDYTLRIDVLTFETRYLAGPHAPPTVVVQVRGALANSRTRVTAGDTVLQATAVASDNRVGAIVEAYDVALTEVVGEVITWVTAQTAG